MSAYTPAEARLDATMTRARITAAARATVAGLAALLAQHPDSVQDRGRIDRLDHVDQREPGRGDGGQRLHLHTGPVGGARGRGDRDRVAVRSRSTSTPCSAIGWHSGIRSGVRFAPMMPATRADAERVALRQPAAPEQVHHLGRGAHRPAATADRTVTSLAETSTIRAAPVSSTWLSSRDRSRPRAYVRSEQGYVAHPGRRGCDARRRMRSIAVVVGRRCSDRRESGTIARHWTLGRHRRNPTSRRDREIAPSHSTTLGTIASTRLDAFRNRGDPPHSHAGRPTVAEPAPLAAMSQTALAAPLSALTATVGSTQHSAFPPETESATALRLSLIAASEFNLQTPTTAVPYAIPIRQGSGADDPGAGRGDAPTSGCNDCGGGVTPRSLALYKRHGGARTRWHDRRAHDRDRRRLTLHVGLVLRGRHRSGGRRPRHGCDLTGGDLTRPDRPGLPGRLGVRINWRIRIRATVHAISWTERRSSSAWPSPRRLGGLATGTGVAIALLSPGALTTQDGLRRRQEHAAGGRRWRRPHTLGWSPTGHRLADTSSALLGLAYIVAVVLGRTAHPAGHRAGHRRPVAQAASGSDLDSA